MVRRPPAHRRETQRLDLAAARGSVQGAGRYARGELGERRVVPMAPGSAARTCGDCALCCKVMAIEQLAKPAGAWCRHCKPGRGCQIYADRPDECRSFNCFWLVNDRLDEHWRPSKSKLVLTTSEDGIEVRCDPGFPDAWRKEPFRSEIREWALSGETH